VQSVARVWGKRLRQSVMAKPSHRLSTIEPTQPVAKVSFAKSSASPVWFLHELPTIHDSWVLYVPAAAGVT
jgi:hypothetical protein